MSLSLSRDHQQKLARVLASVGWEAKFIDVNIATGAVDMRFSRNDGRWLHVRRDSIGRTTVETWQRYIVDGKASRRAASSSVVEDMFVGRASAPGVRAALRHVCDYIENNPAPTLTSCPRYEVRRALAPLVPVI